MIETNKGSQPSAKAVANGQRRQFNRRRLLVLVTVVAAVVLGVYAVSAIRSKGRQAAAEKEIAAGVKNGEFGNRNTWEQAKAAVDKGDLTQEQARDAMRSAWESRMKEELDTFFRLPVGAERDKYLDKRIDEWETRRKERDARAATRPSGNGATAGAGSSAGGPGGGGRGDGRGGGEGGGRGEGWGGGNRGGDGDAKARDEARQARRDSQPPEMMAKMAEFFSAMNQRRVQRGLEPITRMRGGGR